MDKIDSYVRHFLILIALILGLSLVSELREIIAYDSSTIGIISLTTAIICTFASGITLQFHKLNWLTISLILILSAIVILFWFKTYTFGLVVSIFLIYNIIVFFEGTRGHEAEGTVVIVASGCEEEQHRFGDAELNTMMRMRRDLLVITGMVILATKSSFVM